MSVLRSSAVEALTRRSSSSSAAMAVRKHPVNALMYSKLPRRPSACTIARASQTSQPESNSSTQLGTALLPHQCDEKAFCSSLNQYLSNLTSAGQNLPFVYAIRCDLVLDGLGIDIGIVRATDGNIFTEASVQCRIEDDASQSNRRRLFIRGVPNYSDPSNLLDVQYLMQAMPDGIRRAATSSTPSDNSTS